MFVNARMYSVTPRSTAAWRTVIDWALDRAGVAAAWLDHPPPKPIGQMWARDDLACAQMCGLPLSLRRPPATVLAAPVPSPPEYGGRPVYWSYIAVRADAPFRTLEDTFGGTAGYTATDSQSGYFAFRHHLLHRSLSRVPYARVVGGLVNPRGVVAALADRRIDVGPLDSYVFDLIRDGDPAFAAQVRIIGATDPTPIPPLVATSAALPAAAAERMREAFEAIEREPSLDAARRSLLVERFVVPEPAAYLTQKERHDRVVAEADAWA